MNRVAYLVFCFVVLLVALSSFFAYNFFSSKGAIKKNSDNFPYNTTYGSESAPEAPFSMPEVKAPDFPKRICDIRKFGAIEGGAALNTRAFEEAVADCSEKGGGYVLVPKGKWLTGAIHLKSNINLHFEDGAEIIFSTDRNNYLPAVFTRFQGMELYNYSPLIYARDAENIAITGNGKIYGKGETWVSWSSEGRSEEARDRLFDMSVSGIPVEQRNFGNDGSGLRPSFIQFVNCKNILLEDIYMEDGPMWTIHPIYSENIIIRRVKINTYSVNTDGIVIDSSKNAYIKDVDFSTGDDSIAVKSGLEEDGFRINLPSENIIIANCLFVKGHGALAIGSELSGGVINILFQNSEISGNDNGFRIKTTRSRGGFIENIWVNNIQMKKITNEAIIFDADYNSRIGSKIKRKTILKNINVNNIQADNLGTDGSISIHGGDGMAMENIIFKDMRLKSDGPINFNQANDVSLLNILLENKSNNPLLKIKNSTNITVNNLPCEKIEGYCASIKGNDNRNINLLDSSLSNKNIFVEKFSRKAVLIK
jgi:polygalacturonase